MVDPLAPSRDRARRPASAAWMFALGLALLPAAPALARQDEEPADEPATAEAEQAEVEEREQLEDTVFIDPVAKQAMRNNFEQLYTVLPRPRHRAGIDRMARTGQVDRDRHRPPHQGRRAAPDRPRQHRRGHPHRRRRARTSAASRRSRRPAST